MDNGLIYSRYVTGKNHIGRRSESTILGNLLRQGENVAIYEPPKTGKTSLIQQTLQNLEASGDLFNCVDLDLTGIRTVSELVKALGTEVIKTVGASTDELAEIVASYLPNTHFVFDFNEYSISGNILSLSPDPDDNDIRAVFSLPYRIAAAKGRRMIVLLDEFQNVMLTEDGEKVCRIMETVFRNLAPGDNLHASYILCGSMVNAMKAIFEERHFFHRCMERVRLNPISEKDIADFMIKYFLSLGKVIEKDLMYGVCRMFKCDIWYICHFCGICNGIARGYILESILEESLNDLVSIHEPRFKATMSDLTTFQVNLLRAIIDGCTKLSSADVIARYGLNSSANVKRLKEALCKKEILTFNEQDEPEILDPLFEYWVRKHYFGIA